MMKMLYIFLLLLFFFEIGESVNVRKWVKFLDKEAPTSITKMPNYNDQSLGYERTRKFNPCEQNPNICSNNGKCFSQDGNFYCICPKTHYGKTCENIADQTHCQNNQCTNNSTCQSIPVPHKTINTALLERIASERKFGMNDDDLAATEIEISYQCMCIPGYFGVFCEKTEAVRKCEEEYCLGRGRAKVVEGKCKCICDKQFLGHRCEQISPCFEMQCLNGGKCVDKVDMKKETITSYCKCPKKVANLGVKISGERCEIITIPERTPDEAIPCKIGKAYDFLVNLINAASMGNKKEIKSELEKIEQDYDNGKSYEKFVVNGWCEGDAKCVPEVYQIVDEYYYLFRCECSDLAEGRYCEFERETLCSPTREELARGMRYDEKCTSSENGQCIILYDKPHCVCNPDYVGDSCSQFDPCARHPCKHGTCVPIVDSTSAVSYQCICPLSSTLVDGKNCIEDKPEGICKPGMCGKGKCMTCGIHNENDIMPLCNDAEEKRGFRCVCEAGYVQPFCKVHSNPCYQNMCKNGGICVIKEGKTYDCDCLPGTSGTLCEYVEDICSAYGHQICVNGDCVNDEYYRRGFACSCYDGYIGINCEGKIDILSETWIRISKYYQISFPLIACFLTLVIISILLRKCPDSRRRENLAS
ncbi:unnamed protein product [Caenorhabditis angaria]|uniref:EGF-like domain-containing protein n=1 Tax=Caenorhabditis angaria TaxID=860376 RepID=A0A9P1I5W9_9PELO|nr:unnamed protein product [Caenorhabditis angaria]